MKTLMIAAPTSGSGKTTIAMGLLRALKNQGLDVCGCKTGPDYIDRAFLEVASGKPAGNLDLHLQGEQGVYEALALAQSDYCLIEGVMGYFDGMYNTYTGSSYHIATLLDIPTVLVYTPGAEMFSIIPKLKGMAEFEQSTIRAVIFNNITPQYYKLIKDPVEQYTDLTVLGFLPKIPEAAVSSRHLGLVQSLEIADLETKIFRIAEALETHVDIAGVLALMQECQTHDARQPQVKRRAPEICVAIAKDEAFSFYYRENLHILSQCCRVVSFSPLRDACLPPCDMVYLGGGYPELFKDDLARNVSMRRSLKAYAEAGGVIYAECGGFMYLTESIEDAPMVGIFKGKTHVTSRLQHFGYIDIKIKENCLLGNAGDRLTGHEFHHSVSEVDVAPRYNITKTLGTKTWEGGYQYKNVLAGYPHLSFAGNFQALHHLLHAVERKRR